MPASDTQLQLLIDKVLAGDEAARSALLDHACDRLLRLTRKMFHARQDLRRWEQTDDVFQNAMLRLHRALAEVKPESVQAFLQPGGRHDPTHASRPGETPPGAARPGDEAPHGRPAG